MSLGNGRLFLIIETIKAKKISVIYQRRFGASAKWDLALIS
jgi:hypothetical protein